MSAESTRGPLERCSTCGREAAAVKKLFPARASGIPLVICDLCVEESETTIDAVPTRIPGASHACGFCTKNEGQVAIIVGIGPTMICDECVDAYRAELSAGS